MEEPMAKAEEKDVIEESKEKIEETVDKVVEKTKEAGKSLGGILRKVFLASIGAAVVAEEEVVNLINRFVERGEIAEKDGKEMIKEILDKREKEAKETIEKIRGNNTVKVATKADIVALQEKIDALTAKLEDKKAA
jgi:polyhydroxyalkanoate synthesis regulator phasin